MIMITPRDELQMDYTNMHRHMEDSLVLHTHLILCLVCVQGACSSPLPCVILLACSRRRQIQEICICWCCSYLILRIRVCVLVFAGATKRARPMIVVVVAITKT
ncbi:unnamed protein product [Amoebophrya sp. A25]|nr:unnamed protein product [Amoebophrya sp. A25]|eukprot:GSA25T00002162001.1